MEGWQPSVEFVLHRQTIPHLETRVDCFALNGVNFLSGQPKSSENDHVVLKRPALRALRPANKIIHCIPSRRGQLALCTLSNQLSKRPIEMRLRQLQHSLYRWVTWGSERLKQFSRSSQASSTQLQLPEQWKQKQQTDQVAGCSTWSLKKDKDQAWASQISCLCVQMPQMIDNFLFNWKLETARQGENSNEVTDLLFIGYPPPHSAAFLLRWILNVIFFLPALSRETSFRKGNYRI